MIFDVRPKDAKAILGVSTTTIHRYVELGLLHFERAPATGRTPLGVRLFCRAELLALRDTLEAR